MDTNILIAALYDKSPSHIKAIEFISKNKEYVEKFVISSQNILELTSVLINAFKLSPKDFSSNIEALIFDPKVEIIYPDHFSLLKYFELLKNNTKIHTTDLFLVATAISHGVTVFITNDSDFEKILGIKVVDPL
ncbi:MAG: type II toxin-antitoxin system VapC family toxin [bacterium]|nr:type II toxin-antitoxin system VapC family toxin [bacterium]